MKLSKSGQLCFILLLPGVHLRAMPTVSAGGSHSCAILSGNLYCWGANNNGQIGTGNKTNALRPVRIPHPQNHAWIGVSAGYFHTCAVDDTSAAYCWGSNGKGQLGTGAIADSLTPSQVLNPDGLKPLTKVSDISVGAGVVRSLMEKLRAGVRMMMGNWETIRPARRRFLFYYRIRQMFRRFPAACSTLAPGRRTLNSIVGAGTTSANLAMGQKMTPASPFTSSIKSWTLPSVKV